MSEVMSALDRARSYEKEVSAELEHVERLYRIARRIKGNAAYAARTAEKIALLETKLNHEIDRMADAKLEALEYLSILDGEERGLMERYYMLGKNWDRIAVEMYMSDRRVYLIRKKAIKKLEQRFSDTDIRRRYGNRDKTA